jgi:hypothetical protein
VCGAMRSISVNNATGLLRSCGLDPSDVTVTNGTSVTFLARNTSDDVMSCLHARPNVCNASLAQMGEPLDLICVHVCVCLHACVCACLCACNVCVCMCVRVILFADVHVCVCV